MQYQSERCQKAIVRENAIQNRTMPKGNSVRERYTIANAATNNSVRECYAKANDAKRQQCARMLGKSEHCHEATVYETERETVLTQQHSPNPQGPGHEAMLVRRTATLTFAES